jgi:hypothetical protein
LTLFCSGFLLNTQYIVTFDSNRTVTTSTTPGYNQDATGHKRNNEVFEASAARGRETAVGEGGASYSSMGEARQERMRRVNNKKGFTSIVKGKDYRNDEGCDFNKN